MKTKVLLVFSLFLLARVSTAQYVTIPNANFRAFLKQSYPTCFNSQDMMDTTCSAVLTATSIACNFKSIANLQGIRYFKGLINLDCSGNQLTSLPTLPSTLTWLDCSGNQLISLPALPSTLTELNCYQNQLASLPALPSTLTLLECSYNQLTSLPALPSALTKLDCWLNQLTNLPALPSMLTWLNCSHNQLTNLPALPSTLRTLLNCSYNQLTSLPALPSALTELACNGNLLTSLPALPSALWLLNCMSNSNLSCLPHLPSGLNYLFLFDTPITCLPNNPAGLTSTLPICSVPCVLGIEVSPEGSHLVAPNPATESCRVNYDTRGKLGTLTLTDALGRTVKSVELQGSSQHDFSVADMPSGLYYLRINTEGKLLATGKLVVEK